MIRREVALRSPEVLARSASRGDTKAREDLVRAIQNQVYGLALRMLAEPADAEDATQEILIKVLSRLDSFRGECRFTTWVYAVAVNHLRTIHARRRRRQWRSFEQLVELQGSSLPVVAPVAERALLTLELQVLFLRGLRSCLDGDQRRALVLGEFLELSGVEAAQVLGIRPATFRKRLSRARQRMRDCMLRHNAVTEPSDGQPSCRVRLGDLQGLSGARHAR